MKKQVHQTLVGRIFREVILYIRVGKNVWKTARSKGFSPFLFLFGDDSNKFKDRVDHDKSKIADVLVHDTTLRRYNLDTTLIPARYLFQKPHIPANLSFPLVIKPLRGMCSVGVIAVQDKATLERFLKSHHRAYITQPYIEHEVELGISYTRGPAGEVFFGVAIKTPYKWKGVWVDGICILPKRFLHTDVTHMLDEKIYLKLCEKIAEAFNTISFRIDALVRLRGNGFAFESMKIIDVNMGIWVVDEFLFDTKHTDAYTEKELTRKYTYWLLSASKHKVHPSLVRVIYLCFHYVYYHLSLLPYRFNF
jgi:hypothetical protein